MLKIERLTKYIDTQLIFKEISCTINDQHLLISGESGCGKSTLAKIIAGLDTDYQGKLYFNGRLRESYTSKEWMKHIQYVPQYQRDTLNQRNLPHDILNHKVSTLSGGQFQRVWIAKALILEPEILILDEATTNLDVINEEAILQMLISLKMTQLIIISHDTYVLSQFEGIQLQLNKLNN
ncbi:ATP-binding cassette domain-containing protein [Staphylococcus epidermidis]|uniref:ATP-binding cassette domain-containing protein n=1 Tax=Staphylococcus epidermidis TaxID=1282 RepID=UPI001E4C29D1|nr:ATP-binding cassette domain-containing protein [Staphylococcus epidermidis]MCD8926027.1 ATP-binding cassette domain-containing protein [Staphylococcus epidermidis]